MAGAFLLFECLLFEPAAFTATRGLKDLNLVLEQGAAAKQPLPPADLLKGHLTQLVSDGKGSIDWSAVSLGAKG